MLKYFIWRLLGSIVGDQLRITILLCSLLIVILQKKKNKNKNKKIKKKRIVIVDAWCGTKFAEVHLHGPRTVS